MVSDTNVLQTIYNGSWVDKKGPRPARDNEEHWTDGRKTRRPRGFAGARSWGAAGSEATRASRAPGLYAACGLSGRPHGLACDDGGEVTTALGTECAVYTGAATLSVSSSVPERRGPVAPLLLTGPPIITYSLAYAGQVSLLTKSWGAPPGPGQWAPSTSEPAEAEGSCPLPRQGDRAQRPATTTAPARDGELWAPSQHCAPPAHDSPGGQGSILRSKKEMPSAPALAPEWLETLRLRPSTFPRSL